MEITTRFSVGDKVVSIHKERRKEWAPCTACDATGQIVLRDGDSVSCPRCFGRKGKHECREVEWQIRTTGTVGRVVVEVTGPFEGLDTGFDNYKSQPAQTIEESYMCIETGIGSGSLYHGHELFATEEEALAECARRNAKADAEKGVL